MYVPQITERISLETHGGEAGEAKVSESGFKTSDEPLEKVNDDRQDLLDERHNVREESCERGANLGEDRDNSDGADRAHVRHELVAGRKNGLWRKQSVSLLIAYKTVVHTLNTLARDWMVAVLSEEPGGSAAILVEASEMRGVIWPTMFCTVAMFAWAGLIVAGYRTWLIVTSTTKVLY